MNKKKILISAYAFNPTASFQLHPGEDAFGWKMVEQISREHDVWVITHSCNREGVLEALSRGEMPGVNIHFLELPAFLWKRCRTKWGQRIYYYFWQRAALKKAWELHQEIEFDLVHHLTKGQDWRASFMGAKLDLPFVWGPVGGVQRIPRGLGGEYSFVKRLAESVRRMGRWLGRHLPARKKCVRRARMILVCCQETRDKVPKRYRKKVRYFPTHGIDRGNIRVKPVKMRKQKKFRVITVGKNEWTGGFSLAVEAFYRFAADNPKADMTIVGKGQEREQIESLIRELGLADKITFQDWMEREELLKQMKLSDVFLFPSFRDEGAGVVVDAMACGLPVVCVAAGGAGFHVKEKWGIKIQPKSRQYVIDEMVRALSRLNKSEKLRAEMGEAARKRAKEYYEWGRLGKRMLEIYAQIM